MKPFDEAFFFQEKALALSSGLSLRLSEFVNEFPAGSPHELIRITKGFLTHIDAALSGPPSPVRFDYFGLIEVLSKALDWLDNAHTAQTPKALVESLEAIASELFSEAKLLVSPSSEYNYSIVDLIPHYTELANNCLPLSSARALIATFPKALYLVQFPRIERENGLNLAIFGHEFGHPIADEFISAHEQLPIYVSRLAAAKASIQSDSKLSAALASRTNPLEKAQLLSRFVDAVVVMHRRALQELVSDAVGVGLFGPSILFSSLAVFGQTSLDAVASSPSYYPPSRFRLRLMARLLTDAGYIKGLSELKLSPAFENIQLALKRALDHIERLVQADSDVTATTADPIARIAYEWLAQTLPDALSHASLRTKGGAFAADRISREVPGLVERLSKHVPPNEIGVWPKAGIVDWRSGLLAAWLMTLCQIEDSSMNAATRRKALQTTQKVSLKGIEYALLQRQYASFLKKQVLP